MKETLFLNICEIFQLGPLMGEPELIHYGLLNTIWKIKTGNGCFAIKEIKPQQIRNVQDYIFSEQVTSLMSKNNIPAITALNHNNCPLQIIDDTKLLVFNWIEGQTLTLAPATSQQANIMGKLFAKMHLLNLQLPDSNVSTRHEIGLTKWQELLLLAAEKKLNLSDHLRFTIEKLLHWENLYQTSHLKLQQHEIISHRDLNPKNVIWINDTAPCIIDWEWAGLVNPTMELISAAYEWSGLLINEFDANTFIAFISAYYQAGAKMINDPLDALHNSLGKWLEWLAFNIELACRNLPQHDFNNAVREAERTFYFLENLMNKINKIADIAQNVHNQYY